MSSSCALNKVISYPLFSSYSHYFGGMKSNFGYWISSGLPRSHALEVKGCVLVFDIIRSCNGNRISWFFHGGSSSANSHFRYGPSGYVSQKTHCSRFHFLIRFRRGGSRGIIWKLPENEAISASIYLSRFSVHLILNIFSLWFSTSFNLFIILWGAVQLW